MKRAAKRARVTVTCVITVYGPPASDPHWHLPQVLRLASLCPVPTS